MGHGGGKENVQRSEIGRVQSEQCRAQGDARQPQRAKEHKALTTQTAFSKPVRARHPRPAGGRPERHLVQSLAPAASALGPVPRGARTERAGESPAQFASSRPCGIRAPRLLRCAAILLRPRAGIAGRSRGLRVAPCSGGRGDSSLPAPGAAFRAGRKRVSAWRRKQRPVRPSACRSRFERCRGSRRPDSASSRGARSSAFWKRRPRRARAKASRALFSLRCPSLRFFTSAGFPAERAGLRSRVAFSRCAPIAAAEFARSQIRICARLAARPRTAG